MHLKGHTKIQLFDAKTNKLVHEINEDNMITNAISNILNVPQEWMIDQITPKKILDDVLPIKDKGMAGILLFENPIVEDANNILPDINNKAIGHAGSEYSGTNIYRGTLNVNESVALTNGQRLVQDFSTDKANGTIGCVCLTSRKGGDIGVDENSDSQSALAYIDNITKTTFNQSKVIGFFTNDNIQCWAKINKSILTLNYSSGFNPNKISLIQDSSNTLINNAYEPKQIYLEGFNRGDYYFYKDQQYVDNNGVIKGWDSRSVNAETQGQYDIFISYFKVNLLTGEKIISREIKVNFNSFPSGVFENIDPVRGVYYNQNFFQVFSLLDNYIICKVQKDTDADYYYSLILLDQNGNFIEDLNFSQYSSSQGNIYDGYNKLLALEHHYKKGASSWINEDGKIKKYIGIYEDNNGNTSDTCVGPLIYIDKNIYPYYLSTLSQDTIELYKFYPYLASINNLTTPVKKTSGQTMKITYDITQEEG